MCAAKELLIPLQCEFFALEGIVKLLHTYEQVKKRLNPEIQLLGVVLTMFDARNKLARQVKSEAERCFPSDMFKTLIPRNVRLSEAPSHGKSILHYTSSQRVRKPILNWQRKLSGNPQGVKARSFSSVFMKGRNDNFSRGLRGLFLKICWSQWCEASASCVISVEADAGLSGNAFISLPALKLRQVELILI